MSADPGLVSRVASWCVRKLKLRVANYQLAAGKSTRVRLRISPRLARQILAGLRQRRQVRMSLTGVAAGTGRSSPAVRLRIRLKR